MEVGLIALGVFLGLAGEQWRQRAEHREAAHDALRRFEAEFQTNKKAVDAVSLKHVDQLKALRTYIGAHEAALNGRLNDPRVPLPQPEPDTSTNPAFFEYAAWDVAQATGALAYIDPDLAVSIAHVYQVQRQLDESTRAITAAMYSTSSDVTFLKNLTTYYGDCTLLEPRLQRIYDDIIPRLAQASGDASVSSAR